MNWFTECRAQLFCITFLNLHKVRGDSFSRLTVLCCAYCRSLVELFCITSLNLMQSSRVPVSRSRKRLIIVIHTHTIDRILKHWSLNSLADLALQPEHYRRRREYRWAIVFAAFTQGNHLTTYWTYPAFKFSLVESTWRVCSDCYCFCFAAGWLCMRKASHSLRSSAMDHQQETELYRAPTAHLHHRCSCQYRFGSMESTTPLFM